MWIRFKSTRKENSGKFLGQRTYYTGTEAVCILKAVLNGYED